MANEKLLYVDPGTGQYTEAPAAIQTSVGAGSAGRTLQANSDGKVDNTLLDFVVSGTNNNSARPVKGSDMIGTAANQGAKIIGYDNTLTSPYTTAVTAQQAIDDAFSYAQAPGVLYTVGAGGVTKGQMVYISAANTVLPYIDSNLAALASVSRRAIGLAATTAAAGAVVKVVSNNTVLTGVLTGAVPGATYYWIGTGVSATIPVTLGAYIWEIGTAKSATDLHVDSRFLKRNSVT